MHIPVRISNVSVPTEAGTWTIHADRGGSEMDGTRGTRGKKRADNGAFLNFGISGGFLVAEWTGL